MEVRTERHDAALVAGVEGRIDSAVVQEFEDALKVAMGDGGGAVILDLEGVSYVSSAGLRAILLVAREIWKRDATFALCALAEPVRQVFDIAGFDKIIKIHGTRAEALAEAGGAAPGTPG